MKVDRHVQRGDRLSVKAQIFGFGTDLLKSFDIRVNICEQNGDRVILILEISR